MLCQCHFGYDHADERQCHPAYPSGQVAPSMYLQLAQNIWCDKSSMNLLLCVNELEVWPSCGIVYHRRGKHHRLRIASLQFACCASLVGAPPKMLLCQKSCHKCHNGQCESLGVHLQVSRLVCSSPFPGKCFAEKAVVAWFLGMSVSALGAPFPVSWSSFSNLV